MKKITKLAITLMVLLTTLSFHACDNDPKEEPEPPKDDTIVLTNCAGGIYFGDFWDEGYGDYYFLLTNDTKIGQTEQGFDVPMTPGCWLLYIDVWGALSEDHTNPIVPEGTYTLGEERGMNVLTAGFTLATENVEKVGEQYRIVDHYFSEGTVVVTHTEAGYKVEASFVTTDGKSLKFRYEGAISLEDKSDDEEYNPELDGDVTIEPVLARSYKYASYDNCDNHVLMLFTSDNLSYDNVHVNEPGAKLHLDLYTAPGGTLAGTYTEGSVSDVGVITKEPGIFYPGRMWGAGYALGSFLERVNDDLSVEFAVLVEGTLQITANSDGTHTISGEFLSGNEDTISCNWTGVIEPHTSSSEEE